jgi:CheY-like chemotaxis protein
MLPKTPLGKPLNITLIEGEVVFLGEGAVNFSMTLAAARLTLDRMTEVLGAPPVVLMVEDEPVVRALGVTILEDAGYAVITAATAVEALESLEAGLQVHLVFTDVQMPGAFDGLELAYKIRDRWPAIPVLIASGRELEAHAIPDKGRFLPKPYGAADVLRHVGELTAA